MMNFQDARWIQIFFLGSFLGLGLLTRDWTLQLGMVGLAIASCCLGQMLLTRTVTGLPSALITALGLSLLLRTDHGLTMILASLCAIASKGWLRTQDKHIFNPANFGILTAIALTPDAWVSPGQWGEEGWYALMFLAAGGIVLQKVGRWDTSATFLGTYALLEAIRNVWLGWTWDVWMHRLMSGSLLLFALFMLTDPRSIPNAKISRVIWAVAIALLTFVLKNFYFISTAAFWSLFALAPLTVVLDRIFPADRFIWHQSDSIAS
jgi:Na+-transporting NADH:ubiquinone oxidoreductase subunit NqrB